MKYVTVADLISALQKMPPGCPVFGYSVINECDNCFEIVELYTPTKENEDNFAAAVAEDPDWPWIAPPHYCQGDSYVSDYWSKNKKVSPVVYVRESLWSDIGDIRKENKLCPMSIKCTLI